MYISPIWNGGRTKPGQHLWSIPVDKERDFDCILTDAIDELVALRRERDAYRQVVEQLTQDARDLEAEVKRIDAIEPQPFKTKYLVPSTTVWGFTQRMLTRLQAAHRPTQEP